MKSKVREDDSLLVSTEPVIKAQTKKIKDVLNGLIKEIMDKKKYS